MVGRIVGVGATAERSRLERSVPTVVHTEHGPERQRKPERQQRDAEEDEWDFMK